jgi:WD40 repeat protein
MTEDIEKVGGGKTASLMISYSRKDKVFVKQVYDSLVAKGFSPEDIWVDWEGIPLSSDWMAEITKGIQSANAFIFVISPDSVASEVCKKEIELAVESNKRFIPILYREPGKEAKFHEKISSHNWVYIRDEQELEKTLPAFIEAINTDLDWLAQHTRLFNRAKEWDNRGRNDSYLVRGNDLQNAETFISEGAAGKEPAPTPLHIEYVEAARSYAAALRRRNRIITAVVGVVLFVLAVIASIQAVRATNNEQEAIANLNTANTQEAIAQANEKIAIENEEIANANARAANALALASEAINQKNSDTQLSLMLALLSIQETSQDSDIPLDESKSALFASLNTPNVLYTWENGSIVSAVAYDPNGKYIAFGNVDGLVQVVDLGSRGVLYSIQFDDDVSGLDFSPDGGRLGISSWDGTAKVINVESGDRLFSLTGHDGYAINDIEFSPDGNLVATAGGDWNVKLWHASNGSILVTLPSHTQAVNSVDFSPDSTRLVSGSNDDTVILWDLETNSLLNKFRPDGFDTENERVYSAAFNQWGDRIIASGYQTVVVWDAYDYTEIHRLNGNRASVYKVDFAPDGLSMLTASSGVKIWDYYYGTERYNLSSHRGEVTSAIFSQDGNYLLTGSWDTTAKLWAANLLIETLKIKYNVGQNLDANYSSDGEYLVISDASGNIVLYSAKNGDVIDEWSTDIWTKQASFDPQNSRRVISGDDNGILSVWEVERSDPVLSIQAHEGAVISVVFSPDGSRILSTGDDGVARLWDAQTGSPLGELSVEEDDLFRAQFSNDGSQILATGGQNSAYVLDANSGQQILELIGHTDVILGLAFSSDDAFVYTSGYDNTIRKWDAKTGDELLVMTGHTGRVFDLDVSPDDSLLVSASADTTVKGWDTHTGKELYNYLGNNEDASSVAFSPEGKNVLTASWDETTKEFTIDYETLLEIAQEYELRPLTQEECQRFLYRDNCTLTLFGGEPAGTESPDVSAVQSTPTPISETVEVAPTTTETPAPVTDSSDDRSFYIEEFDGNLDSWDGFMVSGIDSQVDAGFDNGSLVIQLSPFEEKVPRFNLVNPDFDYSNVQLELVTTNYGNNANGVSLICQYSDDGWYEFTVSNAGLYSIDAYDPSSGYFQLAGGGSSAIETGKNTNTYTAICNRNELSITINGVFVNTIIDTKYNFVEGKIGVGVSSPDLLPVDVSMESLTISEP